MIPVREFNFLESKNCIVLKLEVWIMISLTCFQWCLEHPQRLMTPSYMYSLGLSPHLDYLVQI